MITQITSEQIDQVMNDGQFRYIKLTGSDGKEYGGWNKTPSAAKKKIESIRDHIKNLPPGQYFVHYRINPGRDEWKYLLMKGSELSQAGSSQMPVIIHQGSQLEKFQTLEEWKRQEQKIKDLEKELEILKIHSSIKDQLNEKPEESPITGFTQSILPQFVPLFDRYMSLQEKKMEINSRQPQIRPMAQAPAPAQEPKKFRPAPDPDSDLWESYLDYLDSMNDLRFQRELIYLKNKQPEIFSAVVNETTESNEE